MTDIHILTNVAIYPSRQSFENVINIGIWLFFCDAPVMLQPSERQVWVNKWAQLECLQRGRWYKSAQLSHNETFVDATLRWTPHSCGDALYYFVTLQQWGKALAESLLALTHALLKLKRMSNEDDRKQVICDGMHANSNITCKLNVF